MHPDDKEYATCAVGERLREVFANLLRMSRSPGGGEPYHLARQMVELVEGVKRFYHILGPGCQQVSCNKW
jgi:hypothetical protein